MVNVKRKLLVLIFALLMSAGCAAQIPVTAPLQAQEPEVAPIEQEQNQAEQAEQDQPQVAASARMVEDMAGRQVGLPEKVTKIFGIDPVGTTMVYTYNPDLMLGWNYAPNDEEKAFILPQYLELPMLGMREKLNAEEIVAQAPDLLLYVGIIDEKSIAEAEAMQKKLAIPVAMLDNDLEKSEQAYAILGAIAGDEARGVELGAHINGIFEKVAAINPEKKTTVYYGNGMDSLDTAPDGSDAAQALSIAQGDNVAKLEGGVNTRMQISPEQLIAFNPEVMFVNGEPKENFSGYDAVNSILQNPAYAQIDAVKSGRVYFVPKAPFAWVDRPTGHNRALGVLWTASLLYPDQADYDIRSEVSAFYKLFYHMDLTDEQLDGFLGAINPSGA